MKSNYLLTLLLVPALLFVLPSCQNSNSEKENVEEHQHHDADTTLTLNNGNKWKLDTVTASNVVEMKTMTNMFAVDPFPPLNTYQIYGNDMISGINKMINECTMTGDEDAALHRWFIPILRQSNTLKNVSDTTQARNVFDSIKTRVDVFPQYFE